MPVHIIGGNANIVSAINGFKHAYHSDFFTVRALAQTYLAAPPNPQTVVPLASSLHDVLCRWGAGQREAPPMETVTQCIATLSDPGVHAALQHLSTTALPSLGTKGTSRSVGGVILPATLAAFDIHLFHALRFLATGLFINNTNATYPMKAVLLITGLMPAFDNQVRNGLKRGGFTGTGKTQYLLPANGLSADGKKISRLPFLLGDCWNVFLPLLSSAIDASLFPQLVNHPGRLFDVLLFMQGNMQNPLVVALRHPLGTWYDFA